jgi:glycerate-2-kinase
MDSATAAARSVVVGLYRAGVAAADPEPAVFAAITRLALRPAGVVAIGKAAAAMARGADRALGEAVGGVIVSGAGAGDGPPRWRHERGSHPTPDTASVRAASAVLDYVDALRAGDAPLLVLLSGGASALFELPAPTLAIGDVAATIRALDLAGAPIDEINLVRRHLSAVKGGRLAARARRPVVTLAVSDVVGDDPATIGSGPTVADTSTPSEALALLAGRGVLAVIPEAVRRHLATGAAGDVGSGPRPAFPVEFEVVVAHTAAMEGAARAAAASGMRCETVAAPLTGPAGPAARAFIDEAARHGDGVVLGCGETTVEVVGPGRGGRNQQAALEAACAMSGGQPRVFLAAGTDGVDGPTEHAGAVVDAGTVDRGRRRGLDAAAHLAANNSAAYLEATNDVIDVGPTGTNVGDLWIVLQGSVAGARDS